MRNCLGVTILTFSGTFVAVAQPIGFGVKAGVPAADFFETGTVTNPTETIRYASETRRYVIGPTAELRLPFGLAVEFDALYRPINFTTTGTITDPVLGAIQSNSSTTGHAWDFPLLVKLRTGSYPLVHPYIEGGPVGRYVGGFDKLVEEVIDDSTQQTRTSDVSEFRKQFYGGVTFGAGVELRAIGLRISPEFRYTRWTSGVDGPIHFNANQADFLLGISF